MTDFMQSWGDKPPQQRGKYHHDNKTDGSQTQYQPLASGFYAKVRL
jgi:hypothetical protein